MLTQQEIRRFEKQMQLPEIGQEGQDKVKNAKVLVVGAGGIGTAVLQLLSAIGVGNIGISDNDIVVDANLQRQTLYGVQDLGKQKAIASKQKLETTFPLVNYTIHNICLGSEIVDDICKKYDIIIDATDDFPTKYLLCEVANKLKMPVIYGFYNNYEAEISVLNYNDGPCLYDLYPEDPLKIRNIKRSEQGIIASVPGLIASLQATEAVKIICGMKGVLSGTLLKINLLDYSIEKKGIRHK